MTHGYGYGRTPVPTYGYGQWAEADWPPGDAVTSAQVSGWLGRMLPPDWFVAPPEVFVDRDEIVIIGRIDEPGVAGSARTRADAVWRRPGDDAGAATSTGSTGTGTADTMRLPAIAPVSAESTSAPVLSTDVPDGQSPHDELTDPERVVKLRKSQPASGIPASGAPAAGESATDTTAVDLAAIDPNTGRTTTRSAAERAAAERGRIARFRDDSRNVRNYISAMLDQRYGRRVSWGVECGNTHKRFTNMAAPVATRLRQRDRQVLDTLVDSGLARSRSEALAWCVRLVGRNAGDWIHQLRAAMAEVDRVRDAGPARKK